MGHRTGMKGFLIYDLTSREILTSRNVIFHEKRFPFKQNSSTTNDNFISPSNSNDALDTSEDLSYPFPYPTFPPTNQASQPPLAPAPSTASPHLHPSNPVPARHSTRSHCLPTYLQDYHHSLAATTTAEPSSSAARYPLSNFLSYTKLSPTHKQFVLAISSQ